LLLVVGVLLASCTPWPLESAAPPDLSPTTAFDAPVADGKLSYLGGDVTIRARFSNLTADTLDFSWRTGRAVILGRGFEVEGQAVTSAWVKVRWDTAAGTRDSLTKLAHDTVAILRNTTTMGLVSVGLENILPRLDSLLVGSTTDTSSQRSVALRGDTICLFAHPGSIAYLRLRFRDPDANYAARLRIALPMKLAQGGTLRWRSDDPGDSILVWQTSDSLFDTCLTVVQSDGMGVGTRNWTLRLATYLEEGSVWVGQRTQLVKFGRTQGGKLLEVARLKGFGEIVGLALDPLREGGLLLGADRKGAAVVKYTSEGALRTVKTKFKGPQSIGCDFDKGWCLVGDADSTGKTSVIRVDGDTATTVGFPGVVGSIAIDQGAYGRAWVAGKDSGFVSRLSGKKLDTTYRGRFSRPSALAFDDSLSLLWVVDLDSGTVTALDSQMTARHVLRGFKQPASISARGGYLWVADSKDQSVSRWKAGVLEKRFTGYRSPSAVMMDPRDSRNAWALDEEGGRLLRFEGDSLAAQTSGSGLERPNLLVVHPGRL